MKKIIVLSIAISFIFSSCSSEKSKVYDKAVEYVKEQLKAPSSAKFESYSNTTIVIIDSAGKGNPFREFMEEINDTSSALKSALKQYDNTVYSTALVKLNYEAQNVFGVFLKKSSDVYLIKWNFKGGSGKWRVFHISDRNF